MPQNSTFENYRLCLDVIIFQLCSKSSTDLSKYMHVLIRHVAFSNTSAYFEVQEHSLTILILLVMKKWKYTYQFISKRIYICMWS